MYKKEGGEMRMEDKRRLGGDFRKYHARVLLEKLTKLTRELRALAPPFRGGYSGRAPLTTAESTRKRELSLPSSPSIGDALVLHYC